MKFAFIALVAAADWDGKDTSGTAANQKTIDFDNTHWVSASMVDLGTDVFKFDGTWDSCTRACKEFYGRVSSGAASSAWACIGTGSVSSDGKSLGGINCDLYYHSSSDATDTWDCPLIDYTGEKFVFSETSVDCTSGGGGGDDDDDKDKDDDKKGDGDSAIKVGATLMTAAIAGLYI